jgi:hypothetical protein
MNLEQQSKNSTVEIPRKEAVKLQQPIPSQTQQSGKQGYYDASNPHGVPLETDSAVPAFVAKPLSGNDVANQVLAESLGPGSTKAELHQPERPVTGGDDYEGN